MFKVCVMCSGNPLEGMKKAEICVHKCVQGRQKSYFVVLANFYGSNPFLELISSQ